MNHATAAGYKIGQKHNVFFFMAVLLSLTSWDFMKPLWTTTTGNVLLVIGAALDVVGFLAMRRLTRIDF